MNRLGLIIVVIVLIAVAVVGVLSYMSLTSSAKPSPIVMLNKWSSSTYTANYTITYTGSINIFGVIGISSSLIGPRITWSQNTLNKILLVLSLKNQTSTLVAMNNIGNNEYNLCIALTGGLTLSYCQHTSPSQLPLINSLSSSSWSFLSRINVNGINSYCYASVSNSSEQSYNVTLCIALNGVLTKAYIIKNTTSGSYSIIMTINGVEVNQFPSSEFNKITSSS
ncbi:hypothetical protein [Caldivirga maquilingensis]|uniref:Uncharacterized protein n=1 Tax=Caldivirga maquilingensis (strain ATCC 700844 / DSM 13496 / JCM 10307 / IC-167) TaxID=397948 RepID=A8MAX0_CALMQ|nr:hypothetical protein [Caldivirga maquilingensis]ABW02599.1 hypothetical protein Cmaq_1776 [Caldivirga maquilingensis IC-167]